MLAGQQDNLTCWHAARQAPPPAGGAGCWTARGAPHHCSADVHPSKVGCSQEVTPTAIQGQRQRVGNAVEGARGVGGAAARRREQKVVGLQAGKASSNPLNFVSITVLVRGTTRHCWPAQGLISAALQGLAAALGAAEAVQARKVAHPAQPGCGGGQPAQARAGVPAPDSTVQPGIQSSLQQAGLGV